MNIASINIGTNTVLFLVAELNLKRKTIKELYKDFRIPRIGKNLTSKKELAPDRISELIDILKYFKSIAKKYNCSKIIAVGTNPFRKAKNREHIITQIFQETGIEIKVLSTEEEGKYGYLGSISTTVLEHDKVIVIDIGGSSTEISYGIGKEFINCDSFQIGAVTLTEEITSSKDIDVSSTNIVNDLICNNIMSLTNKYYNINKIIGIAGTPITLASILLEMKKLDEDTIDGKIFNFKQILSLTEHLCNLTPCEISIKYPVVLNGREDIIQSGALILVNIMQVLSVSDLIVSTRGICHGLMTEHLLKISDTYFE